MIFNFVVKRLHFLANIPIAPQIFDAALLVWTAAFNRRRLEAMESFQQAIVQFPEISLRVHRYGGTGFVLNGREIAHLHGNGLLDIELTRELAEQAVAQGRALPHHVFGSSRWVSVWLRSLDDVPRSFDLLTESLQLQSGGGDNKTACVSKNKTAPGLANRRGVLVCSN